MQPGIDIVDVINLLGAAQGLLLTIAILTLKKSGRTANVLLSGLIITCAVIIVDSVLYRSGYIYSVIHLAEILPSFAYLLGPLLYLYSKALTIASFRFERKHWLHFLPFLAVFLYRLPFVMQTAEYKTAYLNQVFDAYPAELLVIAIGVRLQVLVYILVTLRMLVRHGADIRQLFSSLDDISLNWLRNILVFSAFFWLLSVVRILFVYKIETIQLDSLLFSFLIYSVSYMGLKQPEIFVGVKDAEPAKKYAKSTLSQDKAEQYLKTLLKVMETEKPYTRKDLTLAGLAEQLSVSQHHLSQILNERLNQNFFDFVNQYRVEEAKRWLANRDYAHYSLEAIGKEVGFNAKSTFNAVFKKVAQITPSAYRNHPA